MPTLLIMLVVLMGSMYFMQRNQKKQAQQHMDRLNKLEKGTEVVTIGGLYGVVDEVDHDKRTVTLDVDGVYLTFELIAIKRILSEPAATQAVVLDEVATDDVIEADSAIEE
ncbi:preprotein translocase subunit YajC [Streptococcus pneumoniae]